MSKEEDIKFLKIQTCVLKVNIHCEGCKQKVKKLLQKIDGVYTTAIDAEQGKVTVSGNVDPATLIKKLGKSGKHAELWSSPKGTNNNNNALNKQLQNVKIDNKGQQVAKSQKSGKDQKSAPNTQTQPQAQQLLQQFKWLKDMKLPQFKDQKAAKISSPEDEDLGDEFDDCYDDSYDDDDDDDDDLDDDFDDEFDDEHEELMRAQSLKDLKMRAMNSHGHGAGHPFTNVIQAMNDKKGGSVVNSNKNMPIHMKGGQNEGKNGNGGKEGGNNGGNPNQNQNQSQIGGQNGPKNGGGNKKNTPKIANAAAGGNNNTAQGGKKGSSPQKDMGQVFQEMNFRSGGGGGGGGVPMSQMGMLPQGHISAVQGLPMNAGGYFQGMGPEVSANNPYHQQYLAALMMQQQRQNAGERMQPMTYVRPPSAVAYAPYIPQQYHSGGHEDVHYFNDYNTNSCSVM